MLFIIISLLSFYAGVVQAPAFCAWNVQRMVKHVL